MRFSRRRTPRGDPGRSQGPLGVHTDALSVNVHTRSAAVERRLVHWFGQRPTHVAVLPVIEVAEPRPDQLDGRSARARIELPCVVEPPRREAEVRPVLRTTCESTRRLLRGEGATGHLRDVVCKRRTREIPVQGVIARHFDVTELIFPSQQLARLRDPGASGRVAIPLQVPDRPTEHRSADPVTVVYGYGFSLEREPNGELQSSVEKDRLRALLDLPLATIPGHPPPGLHQMPRLDAQE